MELQLTLSVIAQIMYDSKEAYKFLVDKYICVFGGVNYFMTTYFNICVNLTCWWNEGLGEVNSIAENGTKMINIDYLDH